MIRWIRRRINRARLLRTLKLLRQLDRFLQNTGLSRQERRYFWRSMTSDEDRDKVIDRVAKEANGVLE